MYTIFVHSYKLVENLNVEWNGTIYSNYNRSVWMIIQIIFGIELELVGIGNIKCINVDGIGCFEEFEFSITTTTATTYTSTTDDFYHKLVHAETPHTHTIQVPQLYDWKHKCLIYNYTHYNFYSAKFNYNNTDSDWF